MSPRRSLGSTAWPAGQRTGRLGTRTAVVRRTRGLSLVELLLAMALGLVVALGLVQQYSGGQAAAARLRDRADVQDSGAYALGFLRRSAMAAGYWGCNGRSVRPENGLNGRWAELFEFDVTRSVQAFDYRGDGESVDPNAWSPSLLELPRQTSGGALNALAPGAGIRVDRLAPGADLVVFRRLQAPTLPLAARVSPGDDPVVVEVDGAELEAGDVALISDCRQAALFRITGVVANGPRLRLLRASGAGPYDNANDAALAGAPYGGEAGPQGALVGRVMTEIYFIAAGAAPGVSSLWRRSGAAAPVELVEGITDLQVLLGVDVDLEDGLAAVNRYLPFNELQESHGIRSIALTVRARRGRQTREFAQVVALRNLA